MAQFRNNNKDKFAPTLSAFISPFSARGKDFCTINYQQQNVNMTCMYVTPANRLTDCGKFMLNMSLVS